MIQALYIYNMYCNQKNNNIEWLPVTVNTIIRTSIRSIVMMTMAQGGKLLLSAGDGFDGVVLMLLPLSSGNDYKRFFFF